MKQLITIMFIGLISLSGYAQDKMAKIEFKETTIDYGTIDKGADGVREFKFTNNGKEPLIISNARGSCGCTVPTWPKEPIKPGESSVIKVVVSYKQLLNHLQIETLDRHIPFLFLITLFLCSYLTDHGKLNKAASKDHWQDNFENTTLDYKWITARTSAKPFYRLDAKNKRLQLRASKVPLSSKDHSSMLVARQQHLNFAITAELQLPQAMNIQAGIIDYQNDAFHYFFYIEKTAKGYALVLETVNNGKITRSSSTAITTKHNTIKLGLEQQKDKLTFYYINDAAKRIDVAKNVDAKLVSTQVAGGFTGAMLGVHARAKETPK